MKKILLALVALILAGSGMFILKNRELASQKAIIYAVLPSIPDLSEKPKTLSRRILSADTAIQEESNPSESLIELSRLYHANGFLDEALACYSALSELQPKQAKWPHLTAVILAGYGRLDEAIPLFQSAHAIDPSYAPTSIRHGNALLKKNQISAALAAYQNALAAQDKHPHALLGQGRCHIANGDLAKAQSSLETAFNHSKGKIGGDLLSSVYTERGEDAKAKSTILASGVGAYSDLVDPWSLDLFKECYDPYQIAIGGGQAAFGGNSDLGYELLTRASKLDPKNAMYLFQLGNLALNSGQIAQAESYFKRCIEIQPSFSDGWTSLYSVFQKRGDQAGASAALKTGYRHCPQSPAIMILLAKEAKSQGKLQEAANLLKKSTTYRPNEAAAYIEMAQIFFQLERVDEGINMMRSALKAEPGHPMPLTTLTLDAISRGKRIEARSLLRQVLAHPRIPPVQARELSKSYQAAFGD